MIFNEDFIDRKLAFHKNTLLIQQGIDDARQKAQDHLMNCKSAKCEQTMLDLMVRLKNLERTLASRKEHE